MADNIRATQPNRFEPDIGSDEENKDEEKLI